MKTLILTLLVFTACAGVQPKKDALPEFVDRDRLPEGVEAIDWLCEKAYYKVKKLGPIDLESNRYPSFCLKPIGTKATEEAQYQYRSCFEDSFINQRKTEIDSKIECEVEMRRVYYDTMRKNRYPKRERVPDYD